MTREEIALIADIGGGTSDFSIVRLSPERRHRADRAADILANDGVRIGGTDFDRHLSLGTVMPLLGFGSAMKRGDLAVPGAYYHDLSTWSAINRLYDGRTLREIDDVLRNCARPDLVNRLRTAIEDERGHALAGLVEAAKISTSETGAADLDLGMIERGLSAGLDVDGLGTQTGSLAAAVAARIGSASRRPTCRRADRRPVPHRGLDRAAAPAPGADRRASRGQDGGGRHVRVGRARADHRRRGAIGAGAQDGLTARDAQVDAAPPIADKARRLRNQASPAAPPDAL